MILLTKVLSFFPPDFPPFHFLFILFSSFHLTNIHMSQGKYAVKAAEEIKKLKANVVDPFQWRALNRRTCDFWLIPVITNPRAGLLWARFYDTDEHLDDVNAEIDEISLAEFIFNWVVAPSYPFYQIAEKWNSHTYIDEAISWYLLATTISQICLFCSLVRALIFGSQMKKVVATGMIAFEIVNIILTFLFAVFWYYIGYWFIPFWFDDIWFNLQIYAILPIVSFFGFVNVATSLLPGHSRVDEISNSMKRLVHLVHFCWELLSSPKTKD